MRSLLAGVGLSLLPYFVHPSSVQIVPTYTHWRLTHNEISEPDDPVAGLVSVAQVHAIATTAKAPWLTFFVCRNAIPYRHDMVGLASDDYVFYDQRTTRYERWQWADAVRSCVRVARRLRLPAPTMITQAFGNVWDGPKFRWRCPTHSEFLWTVETAYRLGAGNVVAYTMRDHDCPGLPSNS